MLLHEKRAACAQPREVSSSRRSMAISIAAAIAAGSLGIGAHGRVAARLVHRLVRRADDRRAAGHGLDHRQPEPLEPRGVREHRGAAVEPRQLVVVHVAEPDDARPVERRLLAPSLRADDRQQQVAATEQRMRLDERREILARLERGHREDVVAAELGLRAVGS